MKKKMMLLLTFLLIGIGLATAQVKEVKGTVTSAEDGQPVIGASVVVKGTTVGTVTDANGKFVLKNIPSSAKTLFVSYIGMVTKEVKISSVVAVKLEPDNAMLDEVVVVAFGTSKKSAFTGNATFVKSEDLNKHITTNVANALVGNVSGLQMRSSSGAPGAGAGAINIRGVSSLYAGTDPLIIVDGAPYSGNLSNIPQNDVESVTVLKDAASAALYGARGASGVIIITTKTGKAQEATVNVDVKWGASSRAVQEYNTISDPAQYYEAYYAQANNYALTQSDPAKANNWANKRVLRDLGYQVYTLPDGESLIGMDGKLNPKAVLGRTFTGIDGLTYYLTPDDWKKEAYRTALRQEYNVNLSGSTNRSSFYASLGYLNEDGIIEYSGYERLAARVKADYKVKKWLKIGANVGYVHSNQQSNPGLGTEWGQTNLFYFTSFIAPIYPVYLRTVDKNGQIAYARNSKGDIRYDYGVANGNGGLSRAFLSPGNPIGANFYNDYRVIGNQLNGTFTLDLSITDYLKYNMTNTVIWNESEISDYGSSYVLPKSSVGGEISKYANNTFRTNYIQSLTFFKKFGKHDVNVMLGHEYYKSQYRRLGATAYGNFSPDIKEIDAFATKSNSTSYRTNYNVEGYFANLQYNWNDKYFGSASFRRDASSNFAKSNRWGNFWSVGGAWLINKENFMQNLRWINELKLKVSIGQQGNDNIGNWAYMDMYSLSKSSDTSMAPSFWRIGNPDITWETTTNLNVGLEFAILNNRLSGSFDVYSKKTTDLLFWLSVPESLGSRGYYGNIGDIRNSGVELVLNGKLIKTRKVDWDVNFNISHNKSKILSLPKSKILENGGFREQDYWYREGGELYNYMAYAYAGVDEKTGEALYWYDEDLSDLNKNNASNISNKPGKKHSGKTNNIGHASRYEFGTNLPDAFGGFGTTLRVGNFDASVNFDYQLGGKVYDGRYAELMKPTAGKSDGFTFHKDVFKAWRPDNVKSNIPRWQMNDKYTTARSDRFLTSARYLNFQSFTVGYRLPKNLIRGISNVRVYVAGENLCFWSARKGLDPRYAYGNAASLNTYSPARNISGGLQLTF